MTFKNAGKKVNPYETEIIDDFLVKKLGELRPGDCNGFWKSLFSKNKKSLRSYYLQKIHSLISSTIVETSSDLSTILPNLIKTSLYLVVYFQEELGLQAKQDFQSLLETNLKIYVYYFELIIKLADGNDVQRIEIIIAHLITNRKTDETPKGNNLGEHWFLEEFFLTKIKENISYFNLLAMVCEKILTEYLKKVRELTEEDFKSLCRFFRLIKLFVLEIIKLKLKMEVDKNQDIHIELNKRIKTLQLITKSFLYFPEPIFSMCSNLLHLLEKSEREIFRLVLQETKMRKTTFLKYESVSYKPVIFLINKKMEDSGNISKLFSLKNIQEILLVGEYKLEKHFNTLLVRSFESLLKKLEFDKAIISKIIASDSLLRETFQFLNGQSVKKSQLKSFITNEIEKNGVEKLVGNDEIETELLNIKIDIHEVFNSSVTSYTDNFKSDLENKDDKTFISTLNTIFGLENTSVTTNYLVLSLLRIINRNPITAALNEFVNNSEHSEIISLPVVYTGDKDVLTNLVHFFQTNLEAKKLVLNELEGKNCEDLCKNLEKLPASVLISTKGFITKIKLIIFPINKDPIGMYLEDYFDHSVHGIHRLMDQKFPLLPKLETQRTENQKMPAKKTMTKTESQELNHLQNKYATMKSISVNPSRVQKYFESVIKTKYSSEPSVLLSEEQLAHIRKFATNLEELLPKICEKSMVYYPKTSAMAEKINDAIFLPQTKQKFVLYKAICSLKKQKCEENHKSTKEEESVIEETENIENLDLGELSGSFSVTNENSKQFCFLRQLLLRKYSQNSNKVSEIKVSLEIEKLNFDRKSSITKIYISEVKIKYLLVYGFNISNKASKKIFKNSKLHYHKPGPVLEACVPADETYFLLYGIFLSSKKTKNEENKFFNKNTVIYAKSLKIKVVENKALLLCKIENKIVGNYNEIEVTVHNNDKISEQPASFSFHIPNYV